MKLESGGARRRADGHHGRPEVRALSHAAEEVVRGFNSAGAGYLRDRSPETIASVLPLLRHIALATKGTDRELMDSGVLANALLYAGRWQEAEDMVRSLIPRCVAKGDFRSASAAAGFLFNILLQTGRFEEALKLVEEMKAYTRQAGLGPWTQLLDEGQRLQALNSLGQYEEVLKAVEDAQGADEVAARESDQEESVTPWNVREAILDTGREAAMRSEKYEQALELNAEKIDRGEVPGSDRAGAGPDQLQRLQPAAQAETL